MSYNHEEQTYDRDKVNVGHVSLRPLLACPVIWDRSCLAGPDPEAESQLARRPGAREIRREKHLPLGCLWRGCQVRAHTPKESNDACVKQVKPHRCKV